MKQISYLFLFILTMSCATDTTPTRVIFFGDSITQAGVEPGGYITEIQKLIDADGNSSQYELIGKGIGGNKVYDLYLRLEKDVIALSPDKVVIWIGVNDVWHKLSHGTGTDPDKFVKFYQAIIDRLKEKNIEIILCTPAVVGEKLDLQNELDIPLNQFSDSIRNIAQQNQLALVDIRKFALDYNRQHNAADSAKGILTYDGVHLNTTGNQLIAKEIYKVAF